MADIENFRQRSQKLVEKGKIIRHPGLLQRLAGGCGHSGEGNAECSKEITDENPHLKSLYKGLVLTEVQIQKVFTKHGLLKLNPLGAKIDSYEHEALFHTPVEGEEPAWWCWLARWGTSCRGAPSGPPWRGGEGSITAYLRVFGF